MKVENIKYMSFPVPAEIHIQLKTLASSQGKTYKGLLMELATEFLQREQNQKILSALK
jgi:hypothetical protein